MAKTSSQCKQSKDSCNIKYWTVKVCWNACWCSCKLQLSKAVQNGSYRWPDTIRAHSHQLTVSLADVRYIKCLTSLWKFEELSSRLTYHPCGLVTLSVTIQSPWLPACPRPDGGREYLITVATCLRFGFFPPPKTKYPPFPNGKIITKLIAIVSVHIH